jgi:hypothetical protein
MWLSRIVEGDFLAAVKDTNNRHNVTVDLKSRARLPPIANNSKAGEKVIAARATHWEQVPCKTGTLQ